MHVLLDRLTFSPSSGSSIMHLMPFPRHKQSGDTYGRHSATAEAVAAKRQSISHANYSLSSVILRQSQSPSRLRHHATAVAIALSGCHLSKGLPQAPAFFDYRPRSSQCPRATARVHQTRDERHTAASRPPRQFRQFRLLGAGLATPHPTALTNVISSNSPQSADL